VDGLLSDLGSHTGPDGYAAQAWLTHRLQRDRLYHDAAARGLKGWLAPPIRFFSELPQIFDITRRPVSVLERHIALDRIARKEADAIGLSEDGLDRPGMGRAADRFLGDLLPELASPADLGRLLHVPGADPFGKKRNEWIIRTGQAWLHELDRMGKYDPRSIHALVADAIGAGGLPQALKGARRLHIYGLTTTRTRGRLLQALADQAEVEVVLYLLESEEADEFEPLVPQPTSSSAPSAPSALSAVIPAPDEQRELEYIALRIKQLVTEDRVPLDDIAVVARTGREDARLAYSVLENAGIPATARIRTAFDQVPAIKAVLALLRGAALGWPYRALRQLLESSYFDLKVDLRAIDYLATERRIEGLDQWVARLRGLITRIDVESDDAQKAGLRKGQVTRDADALTAFRDQAARLDGERPVTEWLALTREMLEPGWFDFRKRLCQEVGGRWDVVRLDQQGVDALDEMLREWQGAESGGDAVTAAEWYETLRRFLANNEIALSTPLRTGVQILEAHEAALIPFAHTFVIHANDGEFPKRPGSGGLYSDEERRHQAGLGLGIADRDRQLLRERALWRAVTAGPAVTITYRTADPAGVPLLPSLMVPAHDETTAIPRTRFTWDPPFTPHHADRLATARLPEPVRVPDPLPIRLAILHAYAESRRLGSADGTRPPGELDPWNGLLRDPVVLEKLGTRFGPERPWSPSALEQYAQNPFLFLLERVLYLEEKFEAEEDITPMARGGVIHSVLERFYEKYPGPFPASLSGDTETLYHAVADQVFREVEDAGDWLGLEAIWQVKREEIRQTVRDFLAWELEKFAGWTPHARELSFGMDGAEPATVSGTDITGTPATMLLRGRIDRVDVRQAFGPEHRVVDYKSGTIPETKYYADGAALQGPIYLAALASRGMTPAEAVYLSVKHQKAGAGVSWDSDQARHALRIALTIPGRVRAGIFEPAAAKSLGEWVKYWAGGPAMFRKTAVRKESRFG
jgi:RecB family exonuclease